MPTLPPKTMNRIKAVIKPAWQQAMDILPARWHVILDYLRVYRRLPDLKNPRTFSEKIVSRKIYDRDPRLPDLVDKIRVKEIMARKFGDRFIIPALQIYSSADELDFLREPLSRPPYVLKTNHGSGVNIFVKKIDSSFNPGKIRQELAESLRCDHAAVAEEWAYSKVERKIFVEPYIEMPEGYLADYKFHVFSGRIYAIEVVVDRFRNYGVGFYDKNWNHMDIGYVGRYPRYKGVLSPPVQLTNMMRFAEAIGADFSYVRVDLYQVNEDVKLGELTFYPGAGHDKFDPPEWDMKFGEQWTPDWVLPSS